MKPVLILLPGLSGTSELMKWIVPFLEPYFSLRLVNLPESKTAGDQNYDQLASYIYNQHIACEEGSCWILGESFSGPIAITLAKQYPQHVAGIVLAATFAACPNKLAHKLKNLVFMILHWRFAYQWGGLLFLCGVRAFKLSKKMRRTIFSELSRSSYQTTKDRLLTVVSCDVRSYLPLAQPVLYLNAKHDWLVWKHALATLYHLQPDMEVHSFESPHLVLQFQPQETAQIIIKFMQQNLNNKEDESVSII